LCAVHLVPPNFADAQRTPHILRIERFVVEARRPHFGAAASVALSMGCIIG